MALFSAILDIRKDYIFLESIRANNQKDIYVSIINPQTCNYVAQRIIVSCVSLCCKSWWNDEKDRAEYFRTHICFVLIIRKWCHIFLHCKSAKIARTPHRNRIHWCEVVSYRKRHTEISCHIRKDIREEIIMLYTVTYVSYDWIISAPNEGDQCRIGVSS